jgi:16S rRNA (uracil1498-N3)-methyltransferase
MHRFYCPNTDFSPTKISISNSGEIHHLTHVLRMSKGDQLELFNGQGDEVTGTIESISALEVQVIIKDRRHKKKISSLVILACAIPKKAKFESIIEKCTELGVDEIIPMRTARTEVILKEDRLERKNARYQTVAVNAAKQSARTTVPVVHPQRSFKEIIASFDPKVLRIIPCLAGKRNSLKNVLEDAKGYNKIVFLIGPEGDFTEQELSDALKAGFIPVTLGETVLKVDTAAITAVGFTRLMHL